MVITNYELRITNEDDLIEYRYFSGDCQDNLSGFSETLLAGESTRKGAMNEHEICVFFWW